MWWVLLSTVWAVLCVDLAALQPLHIADDGGLECGRLVATGRGLARSNLDPTNLDPTSLVATGRGLARTRIF